MTVWGLVDDRTGHTGQVLGVIAKLGVPYSLKPLQYNRLVHLPTFLLPSNFLMLKKNSRPKAPWPDLVIAAGRRTAPILRAIKRRSPSTVTVYLMWPGSARGIDLIAAPEHDDPPNAKNVVRTLMPLHAVTPETLVAARDAWAEQFKHLSRPYVTLAIGGNTKHGAYTADDWQRLIEQAQALVGSGSLLITTSRRTPREAIDIIRSHITVPHLLHRWDTAKDNPYLGMLGAADGIVVTGDSLSMCAEACVSGKPVYVFAPKSVIPAKHARLHTTLAERDLVRLLEDGASLTWKPAAPLDETGMVAAEIRKRFPNACK